MATFDELKGLTGTLTNGELVQQVVFETLTQDLAIIRKEMVLVIDKTHRFKIADPLYISVSNSPKGRESLNTLGIGDRAERTILTFWGNEATVADDEDAEGINEE